VAIHLCIISKKIQLKVIFIRVYQIIYKYYKACQNYTKIFTARKQNWREHMVLLFWWKSRTVCSAILTQCISSQTEEIMSAHTLLYIMCHVLWSYHNSYWRTWLQWCTVKHRPTKSNVCITHETHQSRNVVQNEIFPQNALLQVLDEICCQLVNLCAGWTCLSM